MSRAATEAALEALRALTRRGVLRPDVVVDAARDESSPLHDYFTWDDGEAAEQYRLIEARKLIQVHVEVLENCKRKSPVFVSLRDDRAKAGGGYRLMVDVLSDEAKRERLLDEAKRDLETFRSKYHMLSELSRVFAAMDAVK